MWLEPTQESLMVPVRHIKAIDLRRSALAVVISAMVLGAGAAQAETSQPPSVSSAPIADTATGTSRTEVGSEQSNADEDSTSGSYYPYSAGTVGDDPAEPTSTALPPDTMDKVSDTDAVVDDVNIGVSLAANGRVPAGSVDDFLPGEDIIVTMGLNDAAPGTAVSVVWIGPDEQRIAEQRQEVTQGATSLRFVMDGTREWKPGDYRAEVWVGDDKVDDQRFKIVPARSARN
jgi:hypothetical protein